MNACEIFQILNGTLRAKGTAMVLVDSFVNYLPLLHKCAN